MSLINQMLRDLEKRRATESGVTQSGPIAVTLGTGRTHRRSRLIVIVLLVGTAIAALAGYWLAERNRESATTTQAPAIAATAPAAVTPPPVVVAPPALTMIEPDSVVGSDSATTFTVIGTGLSAQSGVVLAWGGGSRPLGAQELTVAGNDRLSFTLATGSAPDIWTVQVVNPDGQRSNLLAVRVTAPPQLEMPVAKVSAERKPRERKQPDAQPAQEPAAGGEAMEKRARPLSDSQQAEQAYQAAYKLLQQGRRDEAEAALRDVVVRFPQHTASREALAALLIAGGRKVEARELLAEGLKRVAAHAPFALLQARLLLEVGEQAAATTTLEHARDAGANSAELDGFLAALYQQQKRYQESIVSYQRALAAQPNQSAWWVGLGISCEGAGSRDDARVAYQRSLTQGGLEPRLRSYAENRLAILQP